MNMDAWQKLLDNPAGLLAVLCLAGVAIVANLALAALLRGATPDLSRWRRSLAAEAGIWRRAATGGSEAQKQQAAQLDELHQLVNQLERKPANDPAQALPPNPPPPNS